MISDFRGEGGSEMTPKNGTLEGINKTLGGGGVKNRQNSSNIIYGWSPRQLTMGWNIFKSNKSFKYLFFLMSRKSQSKIVCRKRIFLDNSDFAFAKIIQTHWPSSKDIEIYSSITNTPLACYIWCIQGRYTSLLKNVICTNKR